MPGVIGYGERITCVRRKRHLRFLRFASVRQHFVEDRADVAAPYKARHAVDLPKDLSLAKLNLRIAGNLYWSPKPARLWQWGCRWRRHVFYDALAGPQRELSLATGGRIAKPAFADAAARDFRLPADHPAIRLGCYPRGAVPGVRLGAMK